MTMKAFLIAPALGLLAGATAANAAHVHAVYSGTMIYTNAEASGYPWGYDALGAYVVGDAYSATIDYDTSAGVTQDFAGGEQAQDERPGFATETFTVNGLTYHSAGSAISFYDRASNFVEFNISYSPQDFGGQFFEVITNNPIALGLNTPLSVQSGFAAGTGGNVVLPGLDAGNYAKPLYGDYTVDSLTITVAAPEPASWALMAAGFAGLGAAGWRRRAALA